MTTLPEHARPSVTPVAYWRDYSGVGQAVARLKSLVDELPLTGYAPTPTGPRLVNVPGQGQTHAGNR